MNDLLDQIKTRVEELLAPAKYDDPFGYPTPPTVHIGALPPKRSEDPSARDFPFVLIRPAHGQDDRSQRLLMVRLVCGVYADEDIASGVSQVHDLAARLLAVQSNRNFTPYRLDLPVAWRSGDGEDFAQPHPYYLVTIDLRFKAPPLADIKG